MNKIVFILSFIMFFSVLVAMQEEDMNIDSTNKDKVSTQGVFIKDEVGISDNTTLRASANLYLDHAVISGEGTFMLTDTVATQIVSRLSSITNLHTWETVVYHFIQLKARGIWEEILASLVAME